MFGVGQSLIGTERLSGTRRERSAHLDSLREQIQPNGAAPVRPFEMSDERTEEGALALGDVGISLLGPAADAAPCRAPFAVLLGCRQVIEGGDKIIFGVGLRNTLISPAPRQLAGRAVIMFTGLDQVEQLEFGEHAAVLCPTVG